MTKLLLRRGGRVVEVPFYKDGTPDNGVKRNTKAGRLKQGQYNMNRATQDQNQILRVDENGIADAGMLPEITVSPRQVYDSN